MEKNRLKILPQRLLGWYETAARDLPWRVDRVPYHVWLSEIMLQQTRVEAVKPYYARFLAALPTIQDLANAPYEQVQKLWEGLGYYSRARNLQKAAQVICQEHNGVFPTEYESIRALPGIGDYTAGAISSICFEMPTPAVDGNVLRVISRLCAMRECVDEPKVKRAVTDALRAVYPEGSCGSFTQSLMELGATVCLPNGAPKCEACPLKDDCRAYLEHNVASFPVRKTKKGRREEELTLFLLYCDGKLALRKRPGSGLLAGLWEFPYVLGTLQTDSALQAVRDFGCEPVNLRSVREKGHVFTHVEWKMRAYDLDVRAIDDDLVWVTKKQLQEEYALPTAFRQFLAE
ncbi:MAG: A/G-specific adenine glycosylase [Ruminococcaceae bacterium]|nr:A/G-specific adenine glycosylase [Oscillospiraceae bacterium]